MLVAPFVADAQHSRLYQIGVIVLGGTHLSTIEGLRDGLRELGLEEGKQYVFHVHDGKGDLKSVEAVARRLEDVQQVDAIVTVSTSVTLAAKRATKSVPIVFYAGTDPVSSGLIDSFRRPGGRSTGIHRQSTDLTAKRLALLKEIVPTLRRVVTFYRADNPIAQASVKIARDAARQLKVELVERAVASVGELRASLRALRPGEADALFLVSDAMVSSQTDLLIEMATTKRLPTMVQEGSSVGNGALAAYGESFYTVGRLSAKHVQRILEGAKPGDLPVEQVKNVYFMINLKTAKALGLTIPPSLLLRADQVIE